jgi:hypothetical protein
METDMPLTLETLDEVIAFVQAGQPEVLTRMQVEVLDAVRETVLRQCPQVHTERFQIALSLAILAGVTHTFEQMAPHEDE